MLMIRQLSRKYGSVFNPKTVKGGSPATLSNLINGSWVPSKSYVDILDPLNGEKILRMPNTDESELSPFIDRMKSIPKSGLHNPLRNVDRYNIYGEVTFRLAAALDRPEIEDHFARCIQRVAPKSYAQCLAEVRVVKAFLKNFGGDQVRFLARGFHVSGDHLGQQSQGYRWPYGPVMIIAPFNFPLEIPVLQLMGALYMGNHATVKAASTVSMVMEEWIRLMLDCGMPPEDVNLIHCSGSMVSRLIEKGKPRLTQFTGSSTVAEKLSILTRGKIKIEDAGFDWKIIGPDVSNVDFVAYTCDQDAYAHTGQKCSAQSMLFVHQNWSKAGLLDKMKHLASRRRLEDLTIGPVLSHTTSEILDHTKSLLEIPGANLLFGGKELSNHRIPSCYGAVEPTAVFVPLSEMGKSEERFKKVTKEIFGPFQVVTEWKSESELSEVLSLCERMDNHLTAAVVSSDPVFVNRVLGSTVNGTTYAGIRARTTGAPQNHWFGPAGDPRGAGIGSPEAIQLVWSCHREIIRDEGPVSASWSTPPPS
jgi:1-pyrroline-5-carboxylate dehydrogenase